MIIQYVTLLFDYSDAKALLDLPLQFGKIEDKDRITRKLFKTYQLRIEDLYSVLSSVKIFLTLNQT